MLLPATTPGLSTRAPAGWHPLCSGGDVELQELGVVGRRCHHRYRTCIAVHNRVEKHRGVSSKCGAPGRVPVPRLSNPSRAGSCQPVRMGPVPGESLARPPCGAPGRVPVPRREVARGRSDGPAQLPPRRRRCLRWPRRTGREGGPVGRRVPLPTQPGSMQLDSVRRTGCEVRSRRPDRCSGGSTPRLVCPDDRQRLVQNLPGKARSDVW